MDRKPLKPLRERKGFQKAVAVAQERHRRLHNAAVAKDEANVRRP